MEEHAETRNHVMHRCKMLNCRLEIVGGIGTGKGMQEVTGNRGPLRLPSRSPFCFHCTTELCPHKRAVVLAAELLSMHLYMHASTHSFVYACIVH